VAGWYRGSQVDDHAQLHRAPKPSLSHSPSPEKAFCPEITSDLDEASPRIAGNYVNGANIAGLPEKSRTRC
jgi:hypothetical protein